MKQLIKITNQNQTVYEGKIINLPFKNDYVIQKSIELFDDDDPCIIHKSYIYKEFGSEIVALFDGQKEIQGKDYKKQLDKLNFKDLENATLTLEG